MWLFWKLTLMGGSAFYTPTFWQIPAMCGWRRDGDYYLMQERHSSGWACSWCILGQQHFKSKPSTDYTALHSLIKATLREFLLVELYYLANMMSLSSHVHYFTAPNDISRVVVYSGELSQTRLFLALLQNTESHLAKCVIAYLTKVESSCTAKVAPYIYSTQNEYNYCAKKQSHGNYKEWCTKPVFSRRYYKTSLIYITHWCIKRCSLSWMVKLWVVSCWVTLLWKHLFNELAFNHKPPDNGQDCRRQGGDDKPSYLIWLNSSGDQFDVKVTRYNHNG